MEEKVRVLSLELLAQKISIASGHHYDVCDKVLVSLFNIISKEVVESDTHVVFRMGDLGTFYSVNSKGKSRAMINKPTESFYSRGRRCLRFRSSKKLIKNLKDKRSII